VLVDSIPGTSLHAIRKILLSSGSRLFRGWALVALRMSLIKLQWLRIFLVFCFSKLSSHLKTKTDSQVPLKTKALTVAVVDYS
jgi:hypothetical protein